MNVRRYVWAIVVSLGLVRCVCEISADPGFDLDDVLGDPSTEAFLTDATFKVARTIDPAAIVTLLVQTFNAPCLLSRNLYVTTCPANKKSVIESPFYIPRLRWDCSRAIGLSPFLNQTSRMFFTEKCDNISSVIAVCDATLLQRISSCVDCARALYPRFNIDPLVIFPLFGNLTVQDRQAGLMIRYDEHAGSLHVHVHAPLVYLERNFYLTQREIDRIEHAFSRILGDNGGFSLGSDDCDPLDNDFVTKHMISDKFGLGDTRLHIDWDVCKGPRYRWGLGFVATIPTAFAFQNGLLGSSLQDRCDSGSFSLVDLIDYAQRGDVGEATKLGQAFFLGALDRLAGNLLDTRLGYDKHLGVGVSMYTKGRLSFFFRRPWAHSIKLRGRMMLQYFMPATETRLFVERKNPDDYESSNFDLERVDDDPVYARQKLEFLTTKLVEDFYPFSLRTKVHPGVMFQWISGMSYASGRWSVEVLSSFWAKTHEIFGDIERRATTPPLMVDRARRPGAYESRIGAALAYTCARTMRNWTMSVYADAAYWGEGIGKDFTCALDLECRF